MRSMATCSVHYSKSKIRGQKHPREVVKNRNDSLVCLCIYASLGLRNLITSCQRLLTKIFLNIIHDHRGSCHHKPEQRPQRRYTFLFINSIFSIHPEKKKTLSFLTQPWASSTICPILIIKPNTGTTPYYVIIPLMYIDTLGRLNIKMSS